MSSTPGGGSTAGPLLTAVLATASAGAIICALISAYTLQSARGRHTSDGTPVLSHDGGGDDARGHYRFLSFQRPRHDTTMATAADARSPSPVAYHTAQGGIVSHYLDPQSRVRTEDFYRHHAQRREHYLRTGHAPSASSSFVSLPSPGVALEGGGEGVQVGPRPAPQRPPPRPRSPSEESLLMDVSLTPTTATTPHVNRRHTASRHSPGSSQVVSPLQAVLPAPPHPIYRIVITGGPCSGKSTGLEYLKRHVESLGYKVLCVPEVATMLMSGGARLWLTPEEFTQEEEETAAQDKLRRVTAAYRDALRSFAALDGDDSEDSSAVATPTTAEAETAASTEKKRTSLTKIVIQRVVLQLMMMLEDCFYEMAVVRGKPTVILCDRGTMDGSAYCSDEEWGQILEATGYTDEELRDTRYDAVIHFVTAAQGAERFYSLENNATRRETLEEAIVQDMATRRAWRGHFLVYIVDNSTDFGKKLERVAAFIRKVIGVSTCGATPRREALATAATAAAAAAAAGQPASIDSVSSQLEQLPVQVPGDLQELAFIMTGVRAPFLPSDRVCASPASCSREVSPRRLQSVMQDVQDTLIGSTLGHMASERDYTEVVEGDGEGEGQRAARDGAGDEEEPEAAVPPPPPHDGKRRGTLPPLPEDDAPPHADPATAAAPVTRHESPLLAAGPELGSGSWARAAEEGLQRHFAVRSMDVRQMPADAVSADIATIFLRPTRHEYLSEVIIRRARDDRPTQRPVYLRRVEYARPLFAGGGGGDGKDGKAARMKDSYVCRNVSTRPISKEEFLALAQHFDPTQPLIQKRTKRFVHGLKHLTVVTFVSPEELRGVSRVVGPPELSVEDLPPWIVVDDGVSLTGKDSFM